MRKPLATAFVTLAIVAAPPFAAVPHAALGDCGQPASTGSSPVATDALVALRAAVGTATCEPCVCDVDGSGATTASDAARILRVSVGQPHSFDCPECAPPACGVADAPACGGTCPEGLTCAPEFEDPDRCGCFDSCQLSETPTCGGSCELSGEPNRVCQLVTIAPAGSQTREFCQCLPMGIQACTDSDAPSCNGACPPGAACGDNGDGSCGCTPLGMQGPCEQSDAPGCAGTCGAETICETDGRGGCTCVPFVGREESCDTADAPMCGGTCASGKMCAVHFDFSCNCSSPCDLSEAPACGGSCLDETKSCVSTTSTVGESSIEHCACY